MTPLLALTLAVIIPACAWYLIAQRRRWRDEERAERRLRDLPPLSDTWTPQWPRRTR